MLSFLDLESFDMGPVRTLQPKMGYPAFFTCNPPSSFPSPAIFWAVIDPGLGFSPVDLTDRITMDHEGRNNLCCKIYFKQYILKFE